MIFTIHIIKPNGKTLLSDLFFMDGLTELHERLSFLNSDVAKESPKNVFTIQISDWEQKVFLAHFKNIEEVQLNKTRIYEQITQKQNEYIVQNKG